MEEASKSNLEISAAQNSLKASSYDVKASKNGFWPKVSASAGYTQDSTSNGSTDSKNYSTTLNATENLFSGFSDSAKIDQAKSTYGVTEANLVSVKAKVSFDLKSAYMGLAYSQKYIKLTEDIIKRRESNLKLVQLRFETGRENSGSVDLSKAYLAQSKLDNLQAQNSKEVFQSQLARVLGRDNFDDIESLEVDGTPPTFDPPMLSNQKMHFKDLALEVPDYKKSVFSEESAKATLDLSNSSFYPSIDLTQKVGRTGREVGVMSNSWSIGAAITFPLFNGGKDYYTSKSSNETYRASVMTRKNTEDVTVTKLKQAYTAYVEAVMKLEVDRAFAVAASSRERIAKAQYNNGLLTFIDWDNIENDLINRQKTLLQTERDRVVAEAAWEQAQGKGVLP